VGLLAALLNRGLSAFEAGFDRLGLPPFWHPLVGALGFALVGLAVPGSLSVGYWAITDAVNGRFLLGMAAALFVGKLVSWWIALASNTSGGTLAPMFLIGATMGEMIGIGFAHLIPAWHLQPAAFALVAMGATFGVAARALFTGAVFALEVTGGFGLVVPMLVAVAVAEVVAEQLLSERIMTDKLVRRGYRVELDTEVHPYRTAVCGQIMVPLPTLCTEAGDRGRRRVLGNPAPLVLAPSVDRYAYAEVAADLVEGGASAVTVTDLGVPVGLIRRADLDRLARRSRDERRIQQPSLHRRPPGERPVGERPVGERPVGEAP